MGTLYEIASTGAESSSVNSTTVVEISEVGDFPGGTGLGATISLAANTTYIIRGTVDILLDTIDVQVDNAAIKGYDRNKDILKASTLTGTMITIGDPTLATYNEFNFTLDNLGLQVPLGRVLEAENIDSTIEAGSIFGRNKVLQIINCEIRDTLKVWTIIGFELVDLLNNLIWFIDGITSDSGCQFQSVRHLEINSCEVFNWTASVGGGSPRMLEIMADNISTSGGSVSQFNAVVNIAGCIIHPINDQIGLYMDSASETKFGTIAANTFIDVSLNTPVGKLFDPLPSGGGYSQASTLTYDIGLNQGLPDSISYILANMSGNTTATVLSTGPPTAYAAINTGGNSTTANSQRWTATTAGIFTYNGTKDIYVSLVFNIAFEKVGGGNDDYEYAIYKNGSIIIASETIRNADRAETFTLVYSDTVIENDFFQVYVKNNDATDNIVIGGWHMLISQ